MASVFRKTFTKPLPNEADIFTRKGQRFARWKDNKGKSRTAPMTTGRDGSDRIVVTAGTYTAKYRDGSGIVREVSTGCRTEQGARSVLTDLTRRAELVKANVLTAAEDAIADHQVTSLARHFDSFVKHLQAKEATEKYISETNRRLNLIADECDFVRLADLQASSFENWLIKNKSEGMGARNRNAFRESLVAFSNWCVRSKRLQVNPFANIPKAKEQADRRRQRRAMAEEELARLLHVAQYRPLAEYGRKTLRMSKTKVNGRATWKKEPLSLDNIDAAVEEARARLKDNQSFLSRQTQLGRERGLIYKTLVLTGLRKAELASLTISQVHLDDPMPYLELAAADEKNREGSLIPLRGDLTCDLRQWIADKNEALNSVAMAASNGQHSTESLDDTALFIVPEGLVRILDRDLKAAGIPKRDERGRTLDVHALRHSFGTLLSKGGVAPRTAQAAMRHSRIDMTMNVYTDPKLLDVQGALDVLPELPLDDKSHSTSQLAKATGTHGGDYSLLAPVLAPTLGHLGASKTFPVTTSLKKRTSSEQHSEAVSAELVKSKSPLSSADNGRHKVEDRGLEPLTFWLPARRSPN
jgi:integrase